MIFKVSSTLDPTKTCDAESFEDKLRSLASCDSPSPVRHVGIVPTDIALTMKVNAKAPEDGDKRSTHNCKKIGISVRAKSSFEVPESTVKHEDGVRDISPLPSSMNCACTDSTITRKPVEMSKIHLHYLG